MKDCVYSEYHKLEFMVKSKNIDGLCDIFLVKQVACEKICWRNNV